jgi:hypothetical protein
MSGKLKRFVYLIPVLPILAIFIATGLAGINFGYHWDEKLQFMLVRNSLESGIFLPGWYKYPSMSYWLSLLGTLPHAILAWPQTGGDWQALFTHLIQVTDTQAYLLQVRAIFLGISALSLLWVYLQPLAWGRSWWEGLAAAAILGFSWEVGYHARWIAPDTVLMQFGALTLLCATLALQRPGHKGWLYASALAAGLACGAKYPGGLLIVPLLIAGYQVSTKDKARKIADQARSGGILPVSAARFLTKSPRVMKAFIPLVLLFVAAYLATTPGTLLEPVRFIKSVGFELRHYSAGFSEQRITPGLPHLGRMVNYLFQALFSHFKPVAWLLASLAPIGAVALFKRSRPLFAMLMVFPALYLLYFCAQTVMRARNLLVLAPFLALLCAQGAGYVWDKLPTNRLRWIWPAFFTGLLALNAIWLGYAAWSIQNRDTGRSTAAMLEYVRRNPENTYWASPDVWVQVERQPGQAPGNLHTLPAGDEGYLVFYASEGMEDPNDWPGNRPGLATRIFGPWEVNLDYYPRWAGEDRILVMQLNKARQIGIQLVR